MKSMKDVARAKAAEKVQRFASGGAVKNDLTVDNSEAPVTRRSGMGNKAGGGTVDGARARSRPDRSARKGGKGKTNVNVVIAPPPAPQASAPPPMPMPSRGATPPPPPMPAPPPAPAAGGAPASPIPGLNSLMRKRGGRVMAKGGKC